MSAAQDERRRDLMRLGGAGAAGAVATALPMQAHAAVEGGTFFDVRRFGAIGDGSGNDRAAIEAAIEAASPPTGSEFERNQRGGIVFLPAGTYRVDRLRVRRNVTLLGEGMGTIIRQIDSANTALIAPASELDYPIGVRDLRIQGARSPAGGGADARGIVLNTQPSYGGFTVPDGQHVVDRVWIERTVAEGIYVARQCRGTLISDCWVRRSERAAGIRVEGSDTTLTNTISRSHAGAGYVIQAGNARLVNCKAFFCRGGGFVLSGTRANLSTCEAQDNWIDGFRIGASDILMNGCFADSNQNAGFHIDPPRGYIGGLCISGFMALGRPEQQSGKPWVGQDIGVLLGDGRLSDSLLSGVARRNNLAQLRLDGTVGDSTRLDSVVQG